jgi:hypothetical protein
VSLPRLFVCLMSLAFALISTPARAFYTRGYFERAAAAGGAGRLYYTGSARERGWDCSACHEGVASRIRVAFETDPPELIGSRRYVPAQLYAIDVILEEEHLGFDAQFNSNGFVAEISKGDARAGTLSSGPGTEILENGRIVVSRNDTRGLARWTFRWTAPDAGTGTVVVNLGAVDGNGAGLADRSFQDHLRDDVFVGTLVLNEAALSGGLDAPAPKARTARLDAREPVARTTTASVPSTPAAADLGLPWTIMGLSLVAWRVARRARRPEAR